MLLKEGPKYNVVLSNKLPSGIPLGDFLAPDRQLLLCPGLIAEAEAADSTRPWVPGNRYFRLHNTSVCEKTTIAIYSDI